MPYRAVIVHADNSVLSMKRNIRQVNSFELGMMATHSTFGNRL